MPRKHNTKHHRSRSNYHKRLKARGLTRTPTMTWTGLSTDQIQRRFAELPRYKWVLVYDQDYHGRKVNVRQIRQEIRN